ncbi:hypothetical protein NIZ20_23500 (plasmid) [Escherichia albertii]|nr:hypothetical protein NIZ20_23500 [Escherichia albertii]
MKTTSLLVMYGASISGLDSDDRDELEAAVCCACTSDEMLTEAFKKVVRNR